MILQQKPTPTTENKRHFTLLEVIVAILILGIALTATLLMSGQSTHNMEMAQKRWAESHQFALAAEHYLLFGPDVPLPNDLLEEGISASCTIEYLDDGTPSFAYEQANLNGWRLGQYKITLYDRDGSPLLEKKIKKMVPDELY